MYSNRHIVCHRASRHTLTLSDVITCDLLTYQLSVPMAKGQLQTTVCECEFSIMTFWRDVICFQPHTEMKQ